MEKETELFFESICRENRSLMDFIGADYTFLNGKLAHLYGIDGVEGDQFRRVTLKGNQPGGLLTQDSILTITSNPTRTSPVKRGKWGLENNLGPALEYCDKCAVERITNSLAKDHYKFSTLILEVVKSAPFQMRRGETPPAEAIASNEGSGK